MRILTKCPIILALVFIVSCGTKFGEDDGATTNSDFVNSKNLDSFVQIQTQGASTPEKYLVYLSWPKIESDKKIRIRLDQTLTVVDAAQTTFSHEVSHDQVLNYVFDILGANNKVEKTFSKQIRIPRDWVVRPGQNEIAKDERIKIQRLFLSSETSLSTNGNSVEIETDELISKSGRIETFPEDSKAMSDQPGRSGGNISIKTRIAIGDLTVALRGEHGGDGSKGPPHQARAQSGTPAGEGDLDCGGVYSVETQRRCQCLSYGKAGTEGQNGVKGFPGLPAQPGGDSGSFLLSAIEGNEFTIDTKVSPGLAGSPGPGGDGQPGGAGGAGGAGSTSSRDCRGSKGKDGLPGEIGAPGAAAENGKSGLVCIYIASTGRNDCHE